jgi:hypothetical protein
LRSEADNWERIRRFILAKRAEAAQNCAIGKAKTMEDVRFLNGVVNTCDDISDEMAKIDGSRPEREDRRTPERQQPGWDH